MLRYLALNGPSIGNQMQEVSNASRMSQSLKDKGLVTIKSGASPRDLHHSRLVNMLSLTIKGLITAITHLDETSPSSTMQQIADHWEHLLPLILGKWDFFRREKMEAYIVLQLRATCLHVLFISRTERGEIIDMASRTFEPIVTFNMLRESTRTDTIQDFFTHFFYQEICQARTREEAIILDVIAQEPEIREYLLTMSRIRENHFGMFLVFTRFAINILEEHEKKSPARGR